MRHKVDLLGTDYFFMFGLNAMVCSGIANYFDSGRQASKSVKEILVNWKNATCSRTGYDILDEEREKLSNTEKSEYGRVWQRRL